MSGPLDGYRIIELAGIGPAPYAGHLMTDMGAEVILVNRPGPMGQIPMISNRGKKTLVLDLSKAEGVQVLLDLAKTADAVFEGLRPGVAERLGVGPEACQKVNPKLVYGRMTGWGQTGPWAKTAGHDINYISITGALEAMGKAGEPPTPPLNLVGDFGGGSMFLVTGILAALLKASKTGKGDIVDAAMIDGVSSMMSIFYSLSGLGRWQEKRESNLLDGAAPFYRCYKTLDNKFMAVGCIEPQFFAIMLSLLEISPAVFGTQNNPDNWPAQHAQLEALFASKTRTEWADIFDGSDACITPVLSYIEAVDHPQNKARGGLKNEGPFIHPGAAPKFSTSDTATNFTIPSANENAREILAMAGYDQGQITKLQKKGVLQA